MTFITDSASFDNIVINNKITLVNTANLGPFATTGSNTFVGSQVVSGSLNLSPGNTINGSSFRAQVTGAFASTSASFSSRLTTIETTGVRNAVTASYAGSGTGTFRGTFIGVVQQQYYAVSASNTITTTTTTFPNTMTNMSIANVPAGTYVLSFSTDISSNTGGASITLRAYIGTTYVANSERIYTRGNQTMAVPVAMAGIVIRVPSTSTISISWIVSAGTGTARARNLTLLRIG